MRDEPERGARAVRAPPRLGPRRAQPRRPPRRGDGAGHRPRVRGARRDAGHRPGPIRGRGPRRRARAGPARARADRACSRRARRADRRAARALRAGRRARALRDRARAARRRRRGGGRGRRLRHLHLRLHRPPPAGRGRPASPRSASSRLQRPGDEHGAARPRARAGRGGGPAHAGRAGRRAARRPESLSAAVAKPITFLSDYGLRDEFVGVVHAVIAHECRDARVIDLSHGVPRQSVLAGALMLARALPYAPPGVHLAVVDPEVGARRRAVALRTALDDRLLVGPDNGLLLPAAERFGWVTEAVEISTSSWRLEPVSATFHGRDLFAPVAARLAAGEALADAGTPLDPEELVRLEPPAPRKGRKQGQLVAHAMVIDGFGNVQLDARPADLEARLGHEVAIGGNGRTARYLRTFADAEPGELLLYEDATGMLALAVNGGL